MDTSGTDSLPLFQVAFRQFADVAHAQRYHSCRKLIEGDVKQLYGQLRSETDRVYVVYHDEAQSRCLLLQVDEWSWLENVQKDLEQRGNTYMGHFGISSDTWKYLMPQHIG